MLLVLSGEGATDFGCVVDGAFVPGPMYWMVDRYVERALDFSPHAFDSVVLVSRGHLSAIAKTTKLSPSIMLPSQKIAPGMVGHRKQAAALSHFALAQQVERQDEAIAVMFRDSDGTNADSAKRWDHFVEAIESGFSGMNFLRGVPMVPRPKQEAWLLCAFKTHPYSGCQALEDEPGNDHAPHPLKAKLAAAVGREPDVDTMCAWITDGVIDLDKIEMRSFSRFRSRLADVLSTFTGGR